jgi:hypothetical protein
LNLDCPVGDRVGCRDRQRDSDRDWQKRSIKLNAKKRKWWLLSNILFVILYFSGLLGTLLPVLFARTVSDRELIYAAHGLILYFDWFLIIPGSLGSLFTGFWLAAGNWGITRHYGVIAKWVGTIAAIFLAVQCWICGWTPPSAPPPPPGNLCKIRISGSVG